MKDSYSILLFILYLIKNNTENKVLTELAFILDKNNLIKLLTYFGGMTIQIPKMDDLNSVIDCLHVYDRVNNGSSVEDALNSMGLDDVRKLAVCKIYNQVIDIINKYEIEIE